MLGSLTLHSSGRQCFKLLNKNIIRNFWYITFLVALSLTQFINLYILIKRWPANPEQPGEVGGRNLAVLPHEVILLKAGRYIPHQSL